MANELDEMEGPTLENGNDVKVIAKKVSPKAQIGLGSMIFDVMWWLLPPIIGGIVWCVMKAKARSHLQQLQQKIQHDASQIDNYLEQRVQILKNAAKLVDKATDLDKTTFTEIAALRAGATSGEDDEARNAYATKLEKLGNSFQLAVENYPTLQAHAAIADAMQQNSYLQREITAAREVYNDTVNAWNRDIFAWPTKMIVAAKADYTTRIPFAIDAATREAARGEFF